MLINAHANHLRLASYRPSSVSARMTCLRGYERSLTETTLTTASRMDVEAFLARPLAPDSRRAYRGHLRGFYLWALDEGYVSSDPTVKLPAVRVPRGVPRPIPDDDLRKAVAQASPRMRAWLMLMALAGLRCMEVAALRPEDVTVTATGPLLFLREVKGGGTATVPAHEAVLAALVALPVRDGLWWDCGPHYVSEQTNAYLHSVGVQATAHRLRHWAGTSWYRASKQDLLTTAQLLRHASVRTTQTYARISPERPAEVVAGVSLPSLRVV